MAEVPAQMVDEEALAVMTGTAFTVIVLETTAVQPDVLVPVTE